MLTCRRTTQQYQRTIRQRYSPCEGPLSLKEHVADKLYQERAPRLSRRRRTMLRRNQAELDLYTVEVTFIKLKQPTPDIVHATCYCARYQVRPTEKHLKEVKRIFRYLKNTINMCLWYRKDIGFELTAFSDLDHAGCLDTRKSTSSGIQFLGGDKIVSRSSKKQDYTSMSLAETEYVSLSACCAQEHVEKGIVELFFVGTEYQLADLFTKALPEDRFKYLVRRLGMRCLTPEELEVLANESA
ncbi:hypothetical protein Tco_0630221 [Tanacetum coccineum]